MSKGQRRALFTMMALSMEKLSLGRPWMTHSLICTGSPSTLAMRKSEEQGMPRPWHSEVHREVACSR